MARRIISEVSFHVVLPSGTSAADLVTGYVPGYRGRVVGWQYIADVAATGTSATRSFNLEIGTADVAGSATTIALADINAAGKVKICAKPTAGNVFSETDTISIESPADGATEFTAGAGTFVLRIEQSARGI